jgi:Tfp pilus assembly protein PilP
MTRQRSILSGLVLLLIGVNVWYWWPWRGEDSRMENSPAARRFLVEDFAVKAPHAAERSKPMRRDLFQPKPVAVAKPAMKGPPPPPPKTPEQLAEEAARAELAQIKLVGVIFRGGRGQAYLVKGDQTFLVFAGDKVGGRFTVEIIAADAVQLKDPATNVAGRIPVSGK